LNIASPSRVSAAVRSLGFRHLGLACGEWDFLAAHHRADGAAPDAAQSSLLCREVEVAPVVTSEVPSATASSATSTRPSWRRRSRMW